VTKILNRAFQAALLRRKPFTEAFFDGESTADAALLVAVVAAVTYGGLVLRVGASFSLTDLFRLVLASVTSWLILGFATWLASSRLFQGSGTPQTMLGLQGLAVLPLLLDMFGSNLIGAVALIWYVAILVVATREATNLEAKNAVVSVLIGLAAAALIRALLAVPFMAFSSIF
jgi:hypothetical protein